jgi:hypothetical protein
MTEGYEKFKFRMDGPTHINISNDKDNVVPKVHKTYEEYLNSDHWSNLKSRSNEIFGYNCICCTAPNNIHHHHLFYRRDWNESRPHEVIPVCKNCHEAIHINGKNIHPEPKDDEAFNKILNRTFLFSQRGGGLDSEIVKKVYYECLSKHNLLVNYLNASRGKKSDWQHRQKRNNKKRNSELEKHKRDRRRRNWSC